MLILFGIIMVIVAFFCFIVLDDGNPITILSVITCLISFILVSVLIDNTKQVLITQNQYELLSIDNGVARYRDGSSIIDISTLDENVSITEVSNDESNGVIYKNEYINEPKIGKVWQDILVFGIYKNEATTTTTYEIYAPQYMIE